MGVSCVHASSDKRRKKLIPVINTNTTLFFIVMFLLRSQTLHRICNGCFYCLEADCGKCNNYSNQSCNSKQPPADINTICKTLQPFIRCPPCNRKCNDERYNNQLNKIF